MTLAAPLQWGLPADAELDALALSDPDGYETICPEAGAILSACGAYRYRLWRHWGDGCMGTVVFLMLNPSTADGHVDDPTIRKCVGFAKRWGRHGIRVVNLFALRSTKPSGLLAHADPVGPLNNDHVRAVARRSQYHDETPDLVVCAWGSCGGTGVRKLVRARLQSLLTHELRDAELLCLGRAQDGSPRHPLMLAYDTKLEPWRAG